MGFVETVTGELLYQIKYFDSQCRVNPLCHGAIFENAALLGHFFRLFLTHGTPQKIRTAQRITCQHLRDLHHLFLIQNDAVSGLQDRLQPLVLVLSVRICQRLPTMLAVNEVFNHPRLQGAGTE